MLANLTGKIIDMTRVFATLIVCLLTIVAAEKAVASVQDFQKVLEDNFKLIQRSSVKTIEPVLEAIQSSGFEGSTEFLSAWQEKRLWYLKANNRFYYVSTQDKKTYQLTDVVTGEIAGEAKKREIKQIKPNSGVRKVLGSALVTFRLVSTNREIRRSSLESIAAEAKPEHVNALKTALEHEDDPRLAEDMKSLLGLLTIQFGETTAERVAAIEGYSGNLNLDVRAKLNPLLDTSIEFAGKLPTDVNVARIIIPGKTSVNEDGSASAMPFLSWFSGTTPELTVKAAYQMLVQAGTAPKLVSKTARDQALVSNISDGKVGGYEVSLLDSEQARNAAYKALSDNGVVPVSPNESDVTRALDSHVFFARFKEPDAAITDAVRSTLSSINSAVRFNKFIDLTLDAVSLASIYFLAAIGLAITFGVMRVINMAHGEFIMMGAYSGYVVQQVITNYTLSIIVAIPVAFAVTFAAGVALERLVIRHLYDRPLETLLATFGVSIALQQLAKNIFGTQARPLTSPDWLDGALVFNDVVSISWIRIAIFVLSVIFFAGLWWTLNRTRLGLETRAVVQNPRMAASMGIDPDRINMLTFGLGSGIAGIAGVAIGLYAKVTSELGSDYIVQSFMTVVIGGVGNIWGTLAGAGLIGILQKLIESWNPSNTLAAQTYMIIFIIVFIQFRPRGLIALKGRAAEA